MFLHEIIPGIRADAVIQLVVERGFLNGVQLVTLGVIGPPDAAGDAGSYSFMLWGIENRDIAEAVFDELCDQLRAAVGDTFAAALIDQEELVVTCGALASEALPNPPT